MTYEIAADVTALLHLTFLAFVLLGGVLGRRRRTWKVLHLVSMGYGVLIEVFYWYCPLTYVEQYLRHKAGRGTYQEAFIQHYLNKVIYLDAPQWSLILAAVLVLAVNIGFYVFWWRKEEDLPQRH